MNKIAIIGTGIMGSGMADHFIKAGYEVYVWNRTKQNSQKLLDKGAKWSETPREATMQASIVFEVTANDESSRSVWLGVDGIITGASENTILVASATLSIDWIDELINLTKNNVFLDIPLTGGRNGAESGNLTMLIGGEKNIYENIKPTLRAVAKTFHYFGERGSGMRFKLLLNMLQAIHITGFAETMRIAKEQGLNVSAVGDALAMRPGGTITELAWDGFRKQPNPPMFSVDWLTKDLQYAKNFANQINTPMLDETLCQYKNVIKNGDGKKDWTIVTQN